MTDAVPAWKFILFRPPVRGTPGLVRVRRGTALAVLLLTLGFNWVRLDNLTRLTGPQQDEGAWIAAALYYTDLVVSGDFTSPAWEGDHLGLFGSINPPLGKLWIGTYLRLHPATRHLHLTREDGYRLSHDLLRDPTPIIDARTLAVARQAHAVSGMLCLLLCFAIAYRIGGVAAAAATTLSVATTPVFEHIMECVYMDGIHNALLLGATLALVESFRATTAARSAGWFVLTGAIFGLAFNVKMTALVLSALLLAPGAVLHLLRFRATWQRALRLFATASVASVLTAVAANPYFWPTASPPPGGGTMDWLTFSLPTYRDDDRSNETGHAPVWLRLAESHFRWRRELAFVAEYVARHHGYRHPPAEIVVRRVLFTYNNRWWGLAAAVAAGVWCVARSARLIRNDLSALAVPALGGAIQLLLLLTALHYVSLRYYLPSAFQLHLFEFCALAVAFSDWSGLRREPATGLSS